MEATLAAVTLLFFLLSAIVLALGVFARIELTRLGDPPRLKKQTPQKLHSGGAVNLAPRCFHVDQFLSGGLDLFFERRHQHARWLVGARPINALRGPPKRHIPAEQLKSLDLRNASRPELTELGALEAAAAERHPVIMMSATSRTIALSDFAFLRSHLSGKRSFKPL